MSENILMIALSPTMETGQIVKWHKKPGDTVEMGDILCEVETDKAVMEYESMNEGTLLKILVHEGETASVAQPIAVIGEKSELGEEAAAVAPVEKPAVKMPEKAAATAVLPTPEAMKPEEKTIEPAEKVPVKMDEHFDRLKVSPLARKLSEKLGVDLSTLHGSGPEGRIVKRDIEEAVEKTKSTTPVVVPEKSITTVKPDAVYTAITSDEILPLSGKRKVIARRLSESKFSAPHYYLKISVIMDDIMEARHNLNASLPEKVSLNAFFFKFVAETLKRHPIVNSTWNEDSIIIHHSMDIGLAVALPDGLITPVVRDCGSKGIVEIDRELKELISKAQAGKLKPEEYLGATFTISNLGSYGIEEFTAVINPPGSAILALGAIMKTPELLEDESLMVFEKMKMTLSCDHRVIDGAVGAEFLRDLKDMMEDPIRAMF